MLFFLEKPLEQIFGLILDTFFDLFPEKIVIGGDIGYGRVVIAAAQRKIDFHPPFIILQQTTEQIEII